MRIYFAAHPKARRVTQKGLVRYEELTTLFEDVVATGEFAEVANIGTGDNEELNEARIAIRKRAAETLDTSRKRAR